MITGFSGINEKRENAFKQKKKDMRESQRNNKCKRW